MKKALFLLFCFLLGMFIPVPRPEQYLPNETFMGEFRRIDEKMARDIKTKREPVSRGIPRTIMMEVTFYSEHYESCGKFPSDPSYGIMASGQRVRKGAVAADTRILPMYSLITIEGLPGVYEVLDRGGGVKGNHIDVYVTSHEEAIKRGRGRKMVNIVRIGNGNAN